MLWEFKQGNSAKATAEKICKVYGERLLADRTAVLEQNPRQSTRCKAERLITSQSTVRVSQQVRSDEKWVTYGNIFRKRHWFDKNEPPSLPDPKANIHSKKFLLCVWWDCRGIIYHELLKPNSMITVDRYVQQLQRVQEKLREKRPALVNRKNVILLHYNARSTKVNQEKFLSLDGLFYHILLTPRILPRQTTTFSFPYKIFELKNFQF
ncbi:histone-lysine N-methyltransferase SETMAR [Trichonephila clavipes]|nr:histone-lysine N-methyltransferase SETMAR [Trichonephila clavipes]